MKIYIINRYSTFTSYSHCHYVSTSRKRAFTEYLDLLHEIVCEYHVPMHDECFLSKDYNGFKDLENINDWECIGENNKEISFYDLNEKSFVRIEFIESNTT